MSIASNRTLWVYDAEVFPNESSVGFKEYGTNNYRQFRKSEFADGTVLDTMTCAMNAFINDEIDAGAEFIGFNSFDYDDNVIAAMRADKTVQEVYALSGRLISGVQDAKPFANPIGWNRIDLFKMMNGFAGLKTLGIMMGHKKLQELPYHYTHVLTLAESNAVLAYNRNDLDLTETLFRELSTEIEMRKTLERDYQFRSYELTSKHDASLASKIIEAEYTLAAGEKPGKPALNTEWQSLGLPLLDPRLTFPNTPALARIRDVMAKASFHYKLVQETRPAVNAQGKEEKRVVRDMSPNRFGGDFRFKNVTYTIGVGGLHSKDEPGRFVADDFYRYYQIDVASMYPSIIIENKVAPSHLDPVSFLAALEGLRQRRLDAKKRGKAGDVEAQHIDAGLKIGINSAYGKFKEAYSYLLDPLASLRVTLNGQLFLLHTIEQLTNAGVEILSANTDGVYVRAPRTIDVQPILDGITAQFGLVFEVDELERYYRTSVSDYLLKFADGKVKSGGAFKDAQGDLKRKGDKSISTVAAVEYLLNDTPILDTIKNCADINRFIASFKVSREFFVVDRANATLPGILRWYETSDKDNGTMLTKVRHADHSDRAKVNGVVNAMLCMDLPDRFPTDINVAHYVEKATELVDKVLNPAPKKKARKAKSIDLLSDDEQEQLNIRRNTTGVSADKLAQIDLTDLIRDYDARIRGNSYQGMKYVMASLCHKHPLNADELYEIGGIVDQNAQKFTINESKKRELRKMAEFFAANTNPYEADALEVEELGIDIKVGDIPCGGGKTYYATNMVAASSVGSVWWWAIDKIDPIAAEREEELKDAFLRNGTAAELDFLAIHSQAEGAGRMIERILRRLHYIENEIAAGNTNRIFVTIITHKALLDNELEDVTGKIIIDEPISVWDQKKLNLARSHRTAFDLVKPHSLKEEDIDSHEVVGDYKAIRLGVTREGQRIAEDDKFKEDAMFEKFYWLCKQAARTNSRVYALEQEWNELGDDADNILHVLVTLTPAHLRNFDEVFMFAAEFDQLFIKSIWEDIYKARFHKLDLTGSWQRAVPLADRTTVYYILGNRPVSKSYMEGNEKRNARNLAEAVLSRWTDHAFIWSTNAEFRAEMPMPQKVTNKHGDVVDSYLTPRANGINQFSNIHRAAWLGSIKLPIQTTTIIREVYGEDARQMMLDNFEFYGIYQFVNRINLRDFDSADAVEIIVADKMQADYLARVMNLPEACIKPLPIPADLDLQDAAPAKGGRSRTGVSTMTEEEKKEYLRVKQQRRRAKLAAADPVKKSAPVRTPEERREYDRQRKAAQRSKKTDI